MRGRSPLIKLLEHAEWIGAQHVQFVLLSRYLRSSTLESREPQTKIAVLTRYPLGILQSGVCELLRVSYVNHHSTIAKISISKHFQLEPDA